jgi:hypothetical protein
MYSAFSEDIRWVTSLSNTEQRGVYALHYKSSYEGKFVMRIFVKRGLTVVCLGKFLPTALLLCSHYLSLMSESYVIINIMWTSGFQLSFTDGLWKRISYSVAPLSHCPSLQYFTVQKLLRFIIVATLPEWREPNEIKTLFNRNKIENFGCFNFCGTLRRFLQHFCWNY